MLSLLLDSLLTLLLASHLLCMNLASGLPLLCILLQWQTRGHDADSATGPVRTLTRFALAAVLVGSLIGLLVGCLMWVVHDRALWAVLPRFERKIWWGLTELGFYIVCLGIYLQLLRSASGPRQIRWWVGLLLALVAGTNLLYHFPPLFGVMASVSHDPSSASDFVTASEFRALMLTGKIVSITVHFWLASLAISGVFAADRILQLRSGNAGDRTPDRDRFVRSAIVIALAATGLQILVGTWVLVQMGPVAQYRLLGGDWGTTILFALGIVGALFAMHLLAKLSFSGFDRKQTRRTLQWMALIVVLMTGAMRHAERTVLPTDSDAVVLPATQSTIR